MPADTRSEIVIQTQFRGRARMLCPRVHIVAIPNAAKRTRWAAQQAKREGMATGFPDVMCIWPGGIAFVEFKSAKGRLSDNQSEWLDRLTALGFPATVSRDPDHALAFLRSAGAPFIGEIAA
ncbi:VRR-NUC domain-containing protein [Sphingomonas sp. 1P06PA]|uniref:VRR-NUC domain-containing protein n=1 Tax=Sphingomonas sp. 1P06PA TaxID=554121 RepID=UPI0039A48538